MCRLYTGWAAAVASAGLLAPLCAAQVQSEPVKWTHVGGTAVAKGLAGLAGGAVARVWYSSGGDRVFIQTAAGRTFESSDYEHWRLNTTDAAPPLPTPAERLKTPESGARVQSLGNRLFALGAKNLYVSGDSGRTWINLTGFNDKPVIGAGQTALAASPRNPQEIVVGNQEGAWRSLDAGLTWASLNDNLPNLPAERLLDQRRIVLRDRSVEEWAGGVWVPSAAEPSRAGESISSSSLSSNPVAYSGTADGRVLVSRDRGATWQDGGRLGPAVPVGKIWSDPEHPDTALAVSGNHLFRTINGGMFWDDVTGIATDVGIHSVAADRTASVVYLATDRGVLMGAVPLNDAGPANPRWISISRDLPAAPALDVRLNNDRSLTVLLDGFGLFEAGAPHRPAVPRVVNAADMSDRAAAPGSLVSVLGARLQQARIGSFPVPILAASNDSSQLQVPFDSAIGSLALALESGSERWTVPLTVKESAPAIFVDADGSPLVLDSATGLVLDSKTAIRGGAVIQILATGLGKVAPEWPMGVPAPLDSPPSVRGNVTAFLDGAPVDVSKATLAPGYVGYYIVELKVPEIVNRGANELSVVMNGEASNRVKIYLEPDSPAER